MQDIHEPNRHPPARVARPEPGHDPGRDPGQGSGLGRRLVDDPNRDPRQMAGRESAVRIRAVRDGELAQDVALDALPDLVAAGGWSIWVDLTEPSVADVTAVADVLGIHHLIVEDIVESNERAKVEQVGEALHLVMFALIRAGQMRTEEIDFVLGRGFVLTVHPGSWDPMAARQLRADLAATIGRGPDFLLWALADSVVDGYFPIFDQLADEIDELQDRVIGGPDPDALREVFDRKRELIRIRHALAPSREMFNQLTSREYALIGEAQVLYFRDVYDHLIRLTDDFDSFRELLSATIDVYLSTVNNNLSAIMKRLTGITVVLAGIGAVGGIFGMSQATPALAGHEGFGFWAITVASIAVAAAAAALLRRIDWI